MVISDPVLELIQRFLINLGSVVEDPIVKTFSAHLLDELENEKNLDKIVLSVSISHPLLMMPTQLDNFARRRMSTMLCDMIKRYILYVQHNNKVPPTIHQAFVNVGHTHMDYHKIETLYNFSLEWT